MRNRIAILLVLYFGLSACAITPTKQSVHFTDDYQSKINSIKSVAVITDVCLKKDVLGDNDHWVISDSRSVEEHMLNATRSYLESKGYNVVYTQAPFVGGFKNRDKALRTLDPQGELKDVIPPLYELESLSGRWEYRDALLNILPRIPITGQSDTIASDIHNPGVESKEYFRVIAENTGGDSTLFLIGHGIIVSTGKQITQGIATGLLTTALTLGTVTVVSHSASVMDTYVLLVDNSTGSIIWSNSLRQKGRDFTDKSFYDQNNWPTIMMYHLPRKIQSVNKEQSLQKVEDHDSIPNSSLGNGDNTIKQKEDSPKGD